MKKEANQFSLSPAIQNAQMDQQQQQTTDKESIFKQMFIEMAYKSFSTKFPFLNEYIVDFKNLSAEADKGDAVGAVYLNIGGKLFIAPVILKNNTMQSMLFIYAQEMDSFLPLTEDWINEILKKAPEDMGSLSKPDLRDLNINNNISQISSLPRYNGLTNFMGKLASLNINLPEVIKGLNKEAKLSLKNYLEKNTKVAEHLLSSYDFNLVKEAFEIEYPKREEKKKDIEVVTPRIPLDYIQKEFGRDKVIMEDMAFQGFHIRDNRDIKNKIVVLTDHLNELENPTKSGVYEIYLSTGEIVPALIIQDPILIDSPCYVDSYYGGKGYKTYHVIAKNKALILLGGRDYTIMKNDNVMSTPTLAEAMKDSDIYKYVYEDKNSEIPIDKPFIFIKKTGNGYIATGAITVKTKTNDKGSIKCTTNYGSNTIIYSEDYKGNNIYVTNNGTVFVPKSFKVVPLKEEVPEAIVLGSMKTILTMLTNNLLERKGTPITIVKDDKAGYSVETNRPVTKQEVIIKVAKEYDVNAKEVEVFINKIDKDGLKIASAFVVPKEDKSEKKANLDMPAGGPMINPTQVANPGLMGNMGQMMGQMAPDQMQQLQQMAMMQQQQQGQYQQGQYLQPQLNMMDAGVDMAHQTGNNDLFDLSALVGLTSVSKLEELLPKFLPNLMVAMDNIARITINFWINADDIQKDIGISEYSALEAKLKNLYNSISDLLIQLNKKVNIFNQANSPLA